MPSFDQVHPSTGGVWSRIRFVYSI